jgi:predicted RNA-binding Zn-ribbon protein involved in translation (DUF1610 family)
METKPTVKASLGIRLLIWTGAGLMTLLLIWLIGFLLKDTRDFRTVDVDAIRARYISAELTARRQALQDEIQSLERRIADGNERCQFLQKGVDSSRETMNQMLGLQAAKQDDPEQQQAVEQARRIFLDNQKAYQDEINQIEELRKQKRDRAATLADVGKKLEGQETLAQSDIRSASEKQNIQAAFLKLLILLPFMALALWLFLSRRGGPYGPLVYPLCIAVLWHVVTVIHEYFPTRYHKYIFTLVAIAAVTRVMVYLIRNVSKPSAKLLLKRYREAYRKQECPACGYPIQRAERGQAELARGAWRKTLVLALAADPQQEQPYNCPSCGQRLFETCGGCGKVRHTLLPACRHCGALEAGGEAVAPENEAG